MYDALDRMWNAQGPAADLDADGSLLAWLSGPAGILQVIDDLCRVDDEGNPPWSVLLDIDRCPTYALPWLGQFVGVRLPPSLPDAQMRQAIRAEQGWQRGTVAAIQAAAAPYLEPGRTARVEERTTDAYHLTVVLYDSWLIPDNLAYIAANYATLTSVEDAFPTLGDFPLTSDVVTAAILAAIPAGLIATVTIRDHDDLGDLIPIGTLTDIEDTFPTLSDVALYEPGS